MSNPDTLPLHMEHDSMTQGLPAAVSSLNEMHAVQRIQQSEEQRRAKRLAEVRKRYGLGAAMKLNAQEKRLAAFHRLPGIPSSFVGLESFTGADGRLEVQDWLGDGDMAEQYFADLHSTMEAKLGL